MSARPVALRALGHRNFRLFIGGLAVSLVGTWIQSIGQSWLLYRLTRSEYWLGVATFCTHIPVLLLGPLGGLMADRFPRHRIVILTQSLFLLQAAALAWLTLTHRVTVPQVLTLAVLLGCANAFDIPARQAMMVLLTSKEDLLGAISINSVAFNFARTVGPSLGGILVAAWGEGICFLVNALSFSAVLVSLLMLRVPPQPVAPEHRSEGVWAGVQYAWRTPAIRRPLWLCGIITLTNAPPLVLGPFVADGIFHRGSAGLGIIMAAFGLGATLGVARLAGRTSDEGMVSVAANGALLYGAALLAYAFAPDFWIVAAAAFLAGFAYFRHNAANNTLIQTIVQDRYRGRVMSFYTMMAVGTLPVGSLLTGIFAERFGPRPVLAAAALIACAAGSAFAWETRNER